MRARRKDNVPPPPLLAPALACLFAAMAGASAQGLPAAQQQPALASPSARGADLYRQGRLSEAADALRAAVKADKADAESWHLLGVVLNSAGKTRDARKAFETAVKRRPTHADAHAGLAYTLLVADKPKDAERAARRALELAPDSAAARYTLGVVRLRQGRSLEALAEADRVLAASPDFAAAHRLRGQAHINVYAEEAVGSIRLSPRRKSPPPPPTPPDPVADARRRGHLAEAARSFEKYLEVNPDAPDAELVREQIESLRVHARQPSNDAEPLVSRVSELTSRAVIVSRPEPLYTEAARKEGVEGAVVLRLVLAADGTVKHIFVVRGLSHGLTENAVASARRISFTPATKDGRPVSQAVSIIYSFNIY